MTTTSAMDQIARYKAVALIARYKAEHAAERFQLHAEAVAYLHANVGKGVVCPTCDQWAKHNRRPMDYKRAAGLIWLVRMYEREPRWYHYCDEAPRGLVSGGEFAKCRYFGLIVEKPNEASHKRTSGWWKPTQAGIDFVYGRIRVPAAVILYAGRLYRAETATVSVAEALHEHFNYQQLMAWVDNPQGDNPPMLSEDV